MAKLTKEKLHELYELLSVPMLDVDCGELCRPANEGVPFCCDQDSTVPLLFWDEFRWQQEQDTFWRRMPVKTKRDRRFAEDCEDENVLLAVCAGPDQCRRKCRALVCRTFPFEPHLDREGRIVGMTFLFGKDHQCPLMKRDDMHYNPTYIRNSMRYWEEIFAVYPDQREFYAKESRSLRKRLKKKGKNVPLFTG